MSQDKGPDAVTTRSKRLSGLVMTGAAAGAPLTPIALAARTSSATEAAQISALGNQGR